MTSHQPDLQSQAFSSRSRNRPDYGLTPFSRLAHGKRQSHLAPLPQQSLANRLIPQLARVLNRDRLGRLSPAEPAKRSGNGVRTTRAGHTCNESSTASSKKTSTDMHASRHHHGSNMGLPSMGRSRRFLRLGSRLKSDSFWTLTAGGLRDTGNCESGCERL